MAGVAAGAGVSTIETPPPPASSPPEPGFAEGAPQGDDPGADHDPSVRFVWLIPALIVAVAAIVIALFAFGVLDGTNDVAAAPTTTLPPVPTTVTPTTAPPPPTTTAPTTTSTTTTTIPQTDSLAPAGDEIPISSLTLKAGGIGPVAFGDAAPDAIGRLVASLGEPDETGSASEDLGLCAGDDGRFARWAGLTVVVSGTFEDGTFAGYRYEDEAVPTIHLDLSTPSGLRVGDPVSVLNEVYSSYQINYLSSQGTNIFQLSDADGLLLWGPVSSTEDSGRVEGIYAPDMCSS